MKTLTYEIKCQYSGVFIGNLTYKTVAGHMPYLSHWDKMVAMHPIFSFPTAKLLAFSRSEWNRLAKAIEDGEATETEETNLRICFLAILHSFGSIIQQEPALPAIHLVQNNMTRLFYLAHWFHYLESERFRFPKIKINRANANTSFDNIADYLQVCFEMKRDYEDGVSEAVEKEKIESAERAMKALRNSWIIPTSNKALWKWVAANLPTKYEAEKQGWMATLFLGTERTILEFDKDEIQLLEEIVISECPNGTPILHAVRQRLDKIMQIYSDNKEAFTVDFEDFSLDDSLIQARAASTNATSTEAPKQADFPTKVAYIKANALWYLQQRSLATKS